MKIIIVTIDTTLPTWRTLPEKIAEIRATLNKAKNANFGPIAVEYRDLLPEVKNGRVTKEWMDGLSAPLWAEGFTFVVLHMSRAQKKILGIEPTLNGTHFVDLDPVSEVYVMADEHSKRGPYNRFVQTTLHELRHAITRGTGVTDDTHQVHGTAGDIRPHFAALDMGAYDPNRALKTRVSLLQRVLQLAKQLMAPTTLYNEAVKALGTDASPKDLALDVVGCAESVSNLIKKVVPDFPIVTGTSSLWQQLEKHPRFTKVSVMRPGDIIVSPTGTSASRSVPNGHAGICGEGDKIMSNTSANGLWEQNYTLTKWKARWGKASYPIYLYHLT